MPSVALFLNTIFKMSLSSYKHDKNKHKCGPYNIPRHMIALCEEQNNILNDTENLTFTQI